MRQLTSRRVLAAGLLSFTLLAGCNQIGNGSRARPVRPVHANSPLTTLAAPDGPADVLPAVDQSAAPSLAIESECAPPAAPTLPPQLPPRAWLLPPQTCGEARACGSSAPAAATLMAPPGRPSQGGSPVPKAVLKAPPAELPRYLPELRPVPQARERPPRRRSFVDLTAAACFSHSPDYRSLNGQVEFLSSRKEWRLRYASVDETDPYGGRVTLIENEHVQYLSDGQYIEAQGRLLNPHESDGRPAYYRIESFRTISRPNAPASQTP